MNEDIICIYADLDSLIERAGLSDGERITIDLMMKGYILSDIAEHFGKTWSNFDILFRRAVKKIVKQNNEDWEACLGARLDDGGE